jgi:hypothetical protein
MMGIELGSGRRTAVVALDHFPEQGKVFISGLRTNFQSSREENSDDQLTAFVNELAPEVIGVDAPLSLPPCMECKISVCPSFSHCEVDSVRWMREQTSRADGKTRYPSPYSQRPVDFLLRGPWQEGMEFPVDESFGASRAPLAAHMQYLKRHLHAENFLEVIPRLALAGIAEQYGLYPREVRRARDVEEGAENRLAILEKMSEAAPSRVPHLFLYNAELVQLAQEISAFDALLCAWMALYKSLDLLETPEFDPAWGYVAKPKLLKRDRPLPSLEP